MELKGNLRRGSALKDHRQKEGLCLQTVGGQLKARLLELADLVRKQWLGGGGWGGLLGFLTCACPQRSCHSGATGSCGCFSAGDTVAWQLALPHTPAPLFSLTHESPWQTHTPSRHGPSITATPSRAGAGSSSVLSAQLRKQARGEGGPGCGRGIIVM